MKSDSKTSPAPAQKPKSKSGLLRLLVAMLLGGLVLVVGGLFILTSSWFITGTVLPMAGGSINSKIEAGGVSGLFSSRLEVTDFKLTPNDQPTLVALKRLSVSYALGEILGGRMVASDFVLEEPVIELVVKADGSLSIDPILESLPPASEKESAPLQVDLKQLKISNGTLRFRQEGAQNGGAVYEIAGLQVELDRLANGQASSLTLSGLVTARVTDANGSSELKAQLDESATVDWNDDLLPTSLQSSLALVVTAVSGVFSEFAENRLDMTAKLGEGRLDPVSLKVFKADRLLAGANVSGPFDLSQGSADLQFSLSDVNENLLNQFRDLLGFGLGKPELAAQGGLKIAPGGQTLDANLKVSGSGFALENAGKQSPSLSFELGLDSNADLSSGSFGVGSLTLNALQNGQPLFSARTAEPLRVNLTEDGLALAGVNAEIEVSQLNLSDWQVALGDGAQGRVSAKLALRGSDSSERVFTVTGSAQVSDLLPPEPDAITNGLGIDAGLNAEVAFQRGFSGLDSINVPSLAVNVRNRQGPLVKAESNMSLDSVQAFALKSQIALSHLSDRSRAPLSLSLTGAGQLGTSQVTLSELSVELPSTTKASVNQIALSGNIDSGSPEGLVGSLKLLAQKLDVTPVLDYLESPDSQSTAKTEDAPADSAPAEDPAPMDLPVKLVTANLKIDEFYARQIKVTKWITDVRVEKNRIQVEPLKLSLNGAEVTGHSNLDLSVPGFRYDVGLKTAGMPVGPFVASVVPSLAGVGDGKLDLNLEVDGEGMTGTKLRKHLKGKATVSFAGANIELLDFWKKFFLTPVAIVLRIPAILDSPIQGLTLDTDFGEGKVKLNEFKVLSPQFQVVSTGEIPIADDLMASALVLPVDMALKSEVAKSANLVKKDAPETDGFITLPKFVSMEGTVGEPKVKIDKIAIGKLFIRNVAGLPQTVVGEAGGALKGLSDLVTGDTDKDNAAGRLIDGVGGLLGGEKGASVKNAGNALRGLFGGGKKEAPKEAEQK